MDIDLTIKRLNEMYSWYLHGYDRHGLKGYLKHLSPECVEQHYNINFSIK